jgi:hypothetical protein
MSGRAVEFGFDELVMHRFGFLRRSGFSVVRADDDLIRFESAERFVIVSFGRLDYQVAVDLGRWIEATGGWREEAYPLAHLVAVETGEERLDRARSVTSREALDRELIRLATLMEQHLSAFIGGSDEFDRMRELNAKQSAVFVDAGQAARLRTHAEEAWRQRDLAGVVLAYEQIDSELTSVALTKSERARLEYARRHLL